MLFRSVVVEVVEEVEEEVVVVVVAEVWVKLVELELVVTVVLAIGVRCSSFVVRRSSFLRTLQG